MIFSALTAAANARRNTLLQGDERPPRTEVSTASIPETLKSERRWVCWIWKRGRHKWSKLPIQPNKKAANSTDPRTWWDFADVVVAYEGDPEIAGIGFILGDGYAGIDFDACYDATTAAVDSRVEEIIRKAGSYTEISPTSTGLKTLLHAEKPRGRCSTDDPAVECYGSGRFFTITGNRYRNSPQTVEDGTETLRWLQSEYLDPTPPSANVQHDGVEIERAREAIRHIPASHADSYEDWIKVGMGAKTVGGDALLEDWIDWSARSDKFPGHEEAMQKWNSLPTRSQVGMGTLVAWAKESGWVPSWKAWSELVPIALPRVPPFPAHALPPVQADWVAAESLATQTPPDMAALLSLTVFAATLAKRVEIQAWEGYREPLNLYAAVVLDPANRKSAVYRDATAPLKTIERDRAEAMRDKIAQEASEYRRAEKRLAKMEKQAAESTDPIKAAEAAAEANRLALQLADWRVPEPPTLRVDDVTSERLAVLLEANGERMAVMSAEGGIFELMAGRYSKSGTDVEVYLKGHSGDALTVQRVSRPPVYLDAPLLTMGLTVQREVIRGLAKQPAFRGRGLLARYIYAMPRSWIGRRAVRTPAVPEEVTAAYNNAVRSLADLPPADAGEPHLLRLSKHAMDVFAQFCEWIETELGSGSLDQMRDWGGKLSGLTLRIAGVMHCVRYAGANPVRAQVTAETMSAAIDIAHWAIPHADAALGLLASSEGDAVREDAEYLLRWLRSLDPVPDTFTRRDAQRHGQQRFNRQPNRLDAALKLLEDTNHIAKRTGAERGGKCTYEVSPYLRGESLIMTDNDDGQHAGQFPLNRLSALSADSAECSDRLATAVSTEADPFAPDGDANQLATVPVFDDPFEWLQTDSVG